MPDFSLLFLMVHCWLKKTCGGNSFHIPVDSTKELKISGLPDWIFFSCVHYELFYASNLFICEKKLPVLQRGGRNGDLDGTATRKLACRGFIKKNFKRKKSSYLKKKMYACKAYCAKKFSCQKIRKKFPSFVTVSLLFFSREYIPPGNFGLKNRIKKRR